MNGMESIGGHVKYGTYLLFNRNGALFLSLNEAAMFNVPSFLPL